MELAQLARAFAATVQASLHGLQTLEPVLQRERSALSGRDPDSLNAVVRDKLAELKALEPSIKARDRLLATLGLQSGIEGGDLLVERIGDASLAADWSQLTELASRVADLNDQNAQLANQGQRATRAALGILTGRPTSDDTYAGLRRRATSAAQHTLGRV
ncbi:MAG: flagellar protein FlgN [Chromatiaceae bacterium]|nr:flagellar protein FlgN [Gammaproteobacteria bacterium]MCP5301022.1 flagellar protein FlgN [Chromatiaceae bacterium]MCP5421506.1 flagellar protein FlgN [Chromatiaceae bacterium]